jgi:hypothetical protein
MRGLAGVVRRLSFEDWAFIVVAGVYVLGVVLPLWSTVILPFMDYPMLLSFVRVFQEHDDPSSPLHGIYVFGPPISPLVLPIVLTSALSALGSIELAGRIVWTLYALGLPAAAWWLGRTFGLSRWNVVLVFPFVYSKWLASGFFGFVTALPLVLCAYALGARWLETSDRKRGLALALLLVAIQLWHALAMAQVVLGLLVIWLCWRAPDLRGRFKALWPVVPAIALFGGWFGSTFIGGRPPPHPGPNFHYAPLKETFDAEFFFSRVLMLYADAHVYTKLFALAAVTMLVLGRRQPLQPSARWRVRNPLALIALIALICFFALPGHALGVSIINHRFAWIAAVLAGVAWRWPAQRATKIASIAAVIALGGAYLVDVNQRFRRFHRETVGASRLINSIPEHASLIAPLSDLETKALQNKPIRELQQYATVRKGGVPTSSFAGYGINYVRYVSDNPRVHFYAHNFLGHPRLREFDYVLLRAPGAVVQRAPSLRQVRADGEWVLYAVCGSSSLPEC